MRVLSKGFGALSKKYSDFSKFEFISPIAPFFNSTKIKNIF